VLDVTQAKKSGAKHFEKLRTDFALGKMRFIFLQRQIKL